MLPKCRRDADARPNTVEHGPAQQPPGTLDRAAQSHTPHYCSAPDGRVAHNEPRVPRPNLDSMPLPDLSLIVGHERHHNHTDPHQPGLPVFLQLLLGDDALRPQLSFPQRRERDRRARQAMERSSTHERLRRVTPRSLRRHAALLEQLLHLLDLGREMLHQDLRLEVGAVVALAVQAVARLVAVLAHHDHRRL